MFGWRISHNICAYLSELQSNNICTLLTSTTTTYLEERRRNKLSQVLSSGKQSKEVSLFRGTSTTTDQMDVLRRLKAE
jgi:hypothetical protein